MPSRLAAWILLSLGAQVTVHVPHVREGTTRPGGTAFYGEAAFVELASLAFNPETHQRQHVRTRGLLDVLEHDRYFVLAEGHARILVLPAAEVPASDLLRFVGGDLDVRGVVRYVRKKEYIQGVDADLVEDPDLPPLPPPRGDWPRVSLTVLGVSDRAAGASGKTRGPGGRDTVAGLLANPAPPGAKPAPVVIVGLFRGRNLFGDLPAATQRKPADWVLKEGESAFWVTGKEPRGKGWSLDPAYPGDTTRWVQVEGKPEIVNGVLYLQATKLSLAKRPEDPAAEEEP